MTERDPTRQGDSAVLERAKRRRPPMYKVLLHNDDYTTQEWVVHVLRHFFQKSHAEAVHLMLTVHMGGMAVVGVFARDIAETKVEQVTHASRDAGFPLRCTCEPE